MPKLQRIAAVAAVAVTCVLPLALCSACAPTASPAPEDSSPWATAEEPQKEGRTPLVDRTMPARVQGTVSDIGFDTLTITTTDGDMVFDCRTPNGRAILKRADVAVGKRVDASYTVWAKSSEPTEDPPQITHLFVYEDVDNITPPGPSR